MLAYGSEVVLLFEVAIHTHRLTSFQEELNDARLREVLDLLPSVHTKAYLRATLHKLESVWQYNWLVKEC